MAFLYMEFLGSRRAFDLVFAMVQGQGLDQLGPKEQDGRTRVAQGLEFVEFITDQVDSSCNLTHRMMFGGCTLYLDGKVVALVCDDQLFVKPTSAGRAFIGNVVEAPAYPGAKNSFLIEDQLDDGDWLTKLLTVTASELPRPRPQEEIEEVAIVSKLSQ